MNLAESFLLGAILGLVIFFLYRPFRRRRFSEEMDAIHAESRRKAQEAMAEMDCQRILPPHPAFAELDAFERKLTAQLSRLQEASKK